MVTEHHSNTTETPVVVRDGPGYFQAYTKITDTSLPACRVEKGEYKFNSCKVPHGRISEEGIVNFTKVLNGGIK